MAANTNVYTLKDADHKSSFLFLRNSLKADGNESANVKIDASTLRGAANNGTERLQINKISWSISSNASVELTWVDNAAANNKPAIYLIGNGTLLLDENGKFPLKNTNNSPSGDIAITTRGFEIVDGCYSVFVEVQKIEGYSRVNSLEVNF